MVDIAISALTEITSANSGDDLVIETGSGTRRISKQNALPLLGDMTLLSVGNVNITNDRVAVFDGTDNLLKIVSYEDILFGNYNNLTKSDAFTLDPADSGSRPIECQGTFTTKSITLSGDTADVGGSTFLISNFSTDNLTITLTNITMFEDGAAVATGIATIRENTTATIHVNNAATEAIFSGG